MSVDKEIRALRADLDSAKRRLAALRVVRGLARQQAFANVDHELERLARIEQAVTTLERHS